MGETIILSKMKNHYDKQIVSQIQITEKYDSTTLISFIDQYFDRREEIHL